MAELNNLEGIRNGRCVATTVYEPVERTRDDGQAIGHRRFAIGEEPLPGISHPRTERADEPCKIPLRKVRDRRTPTTVADAGKAKAPLSLDPRIPGQPAPRHKHVIIDRGNKPFVAKLTQCLGHPRARCDHELSEILTG